MASAAQLEPEVDAASGTTAQLDLEPAGETTSRVEVASAIESAPELARLADLEPEPERESDESEAAEQVAVEPESGDAAETNEPEAGLGSVDGGEVEAAEDSAAEVHDQAVKGADSAEAIPPTTSKSPVRSRRRWWRRG